MLFAGGGVLLAQAPIVTKIAGNRHALALLSDGSVIGWGSAGDGQLGPPATLALTRSRQTKQAVTIPLPGRAIDIAAGEATSYALLTDGTVLAWGSGRQGALGNGAAGGTSHTPIRVTGLQGVTRIAAAEFAAFAITTEGSVYAWGSRANGMLGDGLHPKRYGEDGQPALTPVLIPRLSGIVDISAGYGHVLALTSDGRVFSWGSNFYAALGRPPRREIPMDEPAEIPGLTGVASAAAGYGVSTAIKKDGTVWVWGANWHAQFANGSRTDPPGTDSGWDLVPHKVAAITSATAVSLSLMGQHTMILLKDGTVRGWGNSDLGQVGAGGGPEHFVRPMVSKISGVKAVYAIGNRSYFVKSDGTLWAAGSGDPGEFPLGVNTRVPAPFVLRSPASN